MRDWLALPLNSNSSSSCHSDEAIVTDDEDGRTYDIVKKEEEMEGLPSWFSILNVIGIINQQKKKDSSSGSKRIEQRPAKNKDILCKQDDLVFVGESTDEEVSDHEHVSFQEDEEEEGKQDDYHLLTRTFSSSSIASSVETDNSTPASSQIMRSRHKKNNIMTTVKIYWNHGGKKVQVTGEFDNWSVSVDMVQDNENRHVIEIPMDLSKDIEFKFIVDGEWRYANDLPHRTDWRGNVNNVICKQE